MSDEDDEEDIPKKSVSNNQVLGVILVTVLLGLFVVINPPKATPSYSKSTEIPSTATAQAGFGSLDGMDSLGISTVPAVDLTKSPEEMTFGMVQADGTTVQVTASLLKPREKQILLEPPSEDMGPVKQARGDVTIPKGTIGPPCRSGATFWQTGYSFNWSPGMAWQTAGYHPGLDGSCTDGYAAALSDAVVWRVFEDMPLSDWNSVAYWVSGRVYVLRFGCGNDECFAIYGHLAYPGANDNWPGAGTQLKAGDAVGKIGSTGRSTGPHLHLGIAISKGDNLYWINPATSGAMGKR